MFDFATLRIALIMNGVGAFAVLMHISLTHIVLADDSTHGPRVCPCECECRCEYEPKKRSVSFLITWSNSNRLIQFVYQFTIRNWNDFSLCDWLTFVFVIPISSHNQINFNLDFFTLRSCLAGLFCGRRLFCWLVFQFSFLKAIWFKSVNKISHK